MAKAIAAPSCSGSRAAARRSSTGSRKNRLSKRWKPRSPTRSRPESRSFLGKQRGPTRAGELPRPVDHAEQTDSAAAFTRIADAMLEHASLASQDEEPDRLRAPASIAPDFHSKQNGHRQLQWAWLASENRRDQKATIFSADLTVIWYARNRASSGHLLTGRSSRGTRGSNQSAANRWLHNLGIEHPFAQRLRGGDLADGGSTAFEASTVGTDNGTELTAAHTE
jgi:hypothetical protein